MLDGIRQRGGMYISSSSGLHIFLLSGLWFVTELAALGMVRCIFLGTNLILLEVHSLVYSAVLGNLFLCQHISYPNILLERVDLRR